MCSLALLHVLGTVSRETLVPPFKTILTPVGACMVVSNSGKVKENRKEQNSQIMEKSGKIEMALRGGGGVGTGPMSVCTIHTH